MTALLAPAAWLILAAPLALQSRQTCEPHEHAAHASIDAADLAGIPPEPAVSAYAGPVVSGVAVPALVAKGSAGSGPLPAGTGHHAGNCPAGNARDNFYSPPYEVGIDFVPVTTDDSQGFHVVYSAKSDNNGGVALNSNIYLFPGLDGGLLIFGGGYGDPFGPGTALNDADFDVANVDTVVRQCLGRSPANTPIDFVWPHWHGDHGNDEFIHALESAGYTIRIIAYHEDDASYVEGFGWNDGDRAKFFKLKDGPCNTPIATYPTILGNVWFTARSGHTAGAIDLILDVRNNPNDRFQIRGSVQGTLCPTPPPGTQDQIESHNNVVLTSMAQVVRYGCINPAGSLSFVSGTPKPNQQITLGIDDPTGSVKSGALTFLLISNVPDPRIPCGAPFHSRATSRSYELLLDPLVALSITSPLFGPLWTTPGSPAQLTQRVPPDSSLQGTSVYVQGFLVNPTGGAGRRLALTDGLELRIR